MKTYQISTAKSVFTVLFLALSVGVFSQKIIVWKGGTPGMESDWNCHKNWSTHSVPDEFSDVIIPDVSTTSLAAPVIQSGNVAIHSLAISPDAMLSVKKEARLTVYGKAIGLFGENIRLEGTMFIIDEADNAAMKTTAAVKN